MSTKNTLDPKFEPLPLGGIFWVPLCLTLFAYVLHASFLTKEFLRGARGLRAIAECLAYAGGALWLAALAFWVRHMGRESEERVRKAAWNGLLLAAGLLVLIYAAGPRLGYRGPLASRSSSPSWRYAFCVENTMKCLIDAEANFRKADYDNDGPDYAYNLAQLHDQLDTEGIPIVLIPPSISKGTKEGYSFGTLATYDAAGGSDPKHGFAYSAVPTEYGATGRLSYIVNQTGQIYYKDIWMGVPPTAWPKNPTKEGWALLGE